MMKMLEPIKISNLTVKNRIFYAPMAHVMGCFSEQARDYFARRAQGGAGMVVLNALATDVLEERNVMDYLDENSRDDLEKIVQAVHEYDCKFCLMLNPSLGRLAKKPARNHKVPVSSSDNTAYHLPGVICDALTVEEIQGLIAGFRHTCEVLKTTSVDAFDLQAYGGNLVDQFLTPVWNRRTDEYGGSFENRLRFFGELIDTFKDVMGDDFPLLVKYCPDHYVEAEGFRTMEGEGIKLSQWLEKKGVHMLHVEAGCYDYDQWPLFMPPTYYQEQMKQLRSCEMLRDAVNIPIATDGKLGHVDRSETALQQGKCDALLIGRGLLADPDLANKVAAGVPDEIRPCLYCNTGCLEYVSIGQHIRCAVNPEAGFETTKTLVKTAAPKKVLVVGGGPGGMQAALDAKEAGHDVQLWEKSSALGGMLIAAGRPHFKMEVSNLINYYQLQMVKKNIPYKLSTEATEENILAGGFDTVILATGAKPFIPNVPGTGKMNVVNGIDAMLDRCTLGKHLAIIGGGLVGCELAVFLSQDRGKTIDLIEMKEKLLPEPIHEVNEMALKEMVNTNEHIKVHLNTKLVEIKDGAVVVESGGKISTIPCDTAVIAIGLESVNTLAGKLQGKVDVKVIGDATKPRHIIQATSEARDTVLAL